MKENKPMIEALINTVAIALTTFGVAQILANKYFGFLVIIFGLALEFGKYWGRKEEYW